MFANETEDLFCDEDKAQYTSEHIFICFAVAAAEIGLSYGYLNQIVSYAFLALAHIGVVGAIAAAIRIAAGNGQDLGLLLLLVVSTGLTGPFGAAGTAALSLYLLTLRSSHERLNSWYARISGNIPRDSARAMYEAIYSGRQAVDDFPHNPSFAEILENGSLAQKQIMLGIISRNFDEDFLPVLIKALRSPDPAIRVQAAAVANRLSHEHRNGIWKAVG
jgi:hypothetical protein